MPGEIPPPQRGPFRVVVPAESLSGQGYRTLKLTRQREARALAVMASPDLISQLVDIARDKNEKTDDRIRAASEVLKVAQLFDTKAKEHEGDPWLVVVARLRAREGASEVFAALQAASAPHVYDASSDRELGPADGEVDGSGGGGDQRGDHWDA